MILSLGHGMLHQELTAVVAMCTSLARYYFITYEEEALEAPPYFKEHKGQVES